MLEFQTKIPANAVNIFSHPDKHDDIRSGDFTIDWQLTFVRNKSGLCGFVATINHISGTYTLIEYDDDEDYETAFSFEVDMMDSWKLNTELHMAPDGNLSPASIDIDMKCRTVLCVSEGALYNADQLS